MVILQETLEERDDEVKRLREEIQKKKKTIPDAVKPEPVSISDTEKEIINEELVSPKAEIIYEQNWIEL